MRGLIVIVVVVFVVETEVNMHYLWLFSQDDTSVSWRCHKKHFFILSNAGKPIYSRSVISLPLPVTVECHRTLVWLLLLFKLLPSLFSSFFWGLISSFLFFSFLFFSFLFLILFLPLFLFTDTVWSVYNCVCQVIPQFYSGLNSWLCATVVTVKPLMTFVYWAVITRFWSGVNVGGIDMEMNTSWQDSLQLYKPLCHSWRTGTLQRSKVFRPIALYC